MSDTMKMLIIALALAAVGIIKYYYPAYKDDNPVEVIAEEFIEYETGIHIDLTPLSPEK